MVWIPPDLSPTCSMAQGNLTQCNAIGYAYLALLAQLFGKSVDESKDSYYIDDEDYDAKLETYEDDDKSTAKGKTEYDFIIVGAGSAGCVLANRLSEVEHWNVLLIEAGPEEPNVTSIPAAAAAFTSSNIDWAYKTQPDGKTCLSQLGQSCVWPRGKTMGGSSAINYMTYMRGNRMDYNEWAADGNVGWSYDEVLPYFEKSINLQENFNRTGNKLGFLNVERFSYIDKPSKMIIKAFEEKELPNIPLGLESKVGIDYNLATIKDGQRQSTNTAFIRSIRQKRHNLHIITNALVTKILIDQNSKEAKGIQYLFHGKYSEFYAKKEVIISAGAIDSPKLLKLSGIGPRDELESLNIPVLSNLKVGYNLQDHVTTEALVFSLSNETSTQVSDEEILNQVKDYFNQPEKKVGPMSATGNVNVVAFINTNGSKEAVPDIQIHFIGKQVPDFYYDPATFIATNILPFSFYNAVSVLPLLIKPKSRGYILLNKTDPIFGPPLIYSGFFHVKDDLDTLVKAAKIVVQLENTDAFKRGGAKFIKTPIQGCNTYEWGTDDYFTCLFTHYTITIAHPAGTCKMGPSWDDDAVVDPRFRVYGIKNLRVIDSSTMSKIVRGNLNAPTIMMAEKGSDMIKEDCN